MRYYPIFLDLRGRRCAVVGGGRVAERKVRALLRAGASVHVISPAVTPRLALLAARKKIQLTRRAYRPGDSGRPDSGMGRKARAEFDLRWSSPPLTAPRRKGPSKRMRKRSGHW